jgi:hypothetical protein
LTRSHKHQIADIESHIQVSSDNLCACLTANSTQSTPKKMPATELTVTSAGNVAGKEMLIPTGQEGAYFAHIQDWLTAKLKAKKTVQDVSTQVLVKGVKQWAAYEEKTGSKTVRTVFKIT